MLPHGGAYHIGLRPEQVPDLIIAVGDPDRVEKVSRYFDSIDFKQQHREFISHGGVYMGKNILAISTGIGTDNVEIVLTELDALVNVDFPSRLPKKEKRKLNIVRVGTSGALQSDIKTGSEVVSIFGIGLDALMNFYKMMPNLFEMEMSSAIKQAAGLRIEPYVAQGSDMLAAKIGFDMIKGNTITTPGFYAPQGRTVMAEAAYPNLLNDLAQFQTGDFRLTNFEMETAAYYALGNLLGHEMLSVSAILVNRPLNEFAKEPEKVVDGLIRKVLERI